MVTSSGLHELFEKELCLLSGAHRQNAPQAGSSVDIATNPKLKRLLKTGSAWDQKQVKRLEKVFAAAKLTASDRHNPVIDSIDKVNQSLLAETGNAIERDLVAITGAQTTLHYFIAKYGAARAYAESLGLTKAAALLGQTAKEAGFADRQFTKVAETILGKAKAAEAAYTESSSGLGSTLTWLALAGAVAAGFNALKGSREVNRA